jgi:ketol-acid reductoisomerase
MAVINFGGEKEKVVTRKEFTLARARRVLKDETVAVIGYGVQGPAQAPRVPRRRSTCATTE